MKTFKITYRNLDGEIDFNIEMAAEKWMLEGQIEDWGLGTTIKIEEVK